MFPVIDKEKQIVSLEGLEKSKKLTATRLSAVLGLDEYSTPFKMWAVISKMHQEDMRDNPYLLAGKLLEPRIIEFMKNQESGLMTPEEYYGKRSMDIYRDNKILGGVPDLFKVGENKEIIEIIELKTFSNASKWASGPPEKYKSQTGYYAELSGVDKIRICGLYLGDYDITDMDELLTINVSSANLLSFSFSMAKDFPNMRKQMDKGEEWYRQHVLTGVSPKYDKVRDYAVITSIEEVCKSVTDESVLQMWERFNYLNVNLEMISALTNEMTKEKKALTAKIKPLIKLEKAPSFFGGTQIITKPTETKSYNEASMIADGVLDRYQDIKAGFKTTVKVDHTTIKEERVPCIGVDEYGQIIVSHFSKKNNSITEGLFWDMQAPYAIGETKSFFVAYGNIGFGPNATKFEFGGLKVFNKCIIYRKDLSNISADDLGEVLEEFAEAFQEKTEEDEPTRYFE